jgi:hypothetical protein
MRRLHRVYTVCTYQEVYKPVNCPSAVFFLPSSKQVAKSTEIDNEIHPIIELPTIADIKASTDVLSIRTNTIKVV